MATNERYTVRFENTSPPFKEYSKEIWRFVRLSLTNKALIAKSEAEAGRWIHSHRDFVPLGLRR